MRFSIIIPLYNKAPYIKKALDSVRRQTFRDFELIVVDDGSTDDSLCIAEDTLEKSGIDCQLICQNNAGVSTARNNGFAASHGDYICFLDADDWWAFSFLERMDWLIREYPEAGIYGTNYYYVKNGKPSVGVTTAETGYIDYCKVYAERLQMPLWTGATCIQKRVFHEMGGFDPGLRLGEDFCLWIQVALRYKVAFLNEALSFYSQDSDAAWRLVGKLQDPSHHMLWNLDILSHEEASNADYKKLIDRLRTYDLLPYYLSRQYHDAAKKELEKVDWVNQPGRIRRLYRTPVGILRIRQAVLKVGSSLKQAIQKIV